LETEDPSVKDAHGNLIILIICPIAMA